MTKQQKKKRLIYIGVVSFWIALFVLIGVISSLISPITAQAIVLSENNFDNTEIEDDLSDLDWSEYPPDNKGTIKIIEFVEYCYTDNVFKQSHYGLYLYIYNPMQLSFSPNEGANVINMATSYDDNGKPASYENLSLTYLDKTTGENSNLFYKFKVTNPNTLLENAREYSKNFGERRYDISDVQFRILGNNAVETRDYEIGGTWHYTGYAAGYGSDESTLECTKTDLETVTLDVRSTVYRPGVDASGDYIEQTALNSVYFAVPDRLYNEYGELRRIKAMWDQYETGLIGVFNDQATYDLFDSVVGIKYSPDVTDRMLFGDWSEVTRAYNVWTPTGWQTSWNNHVNISKFIYGYNPDKYNMSIFNADTNPLGAWESWGDVYDLMTAAYLCDDPSTFTIPGEDFLAKLREYSNELGGYKINDEYSSALFGTTEEDYAEHHVVKEIDSDAEFDLSATVVGDSFWFGWLGVQDSTTVEYKDIKAIKEVTAADLVGTDEEVANRLFINENDVADLKSYYEQNNITNHIVLFRFAQSDYMSAKVWSNVTEDYSKIEVGYAAKETVYLSFDIISLTFYRDGLYTVIPVVMSPIDIAGDITPPPSGCGNWGDCAGFPWWIIPVIILAVILFILLLPLLPSLLLALGKFLLLLLKLLWKIIKAPFVLGKKIAAKVKERKAAKAAKTGKTAKTGKKVKPGKVAKTAKTGKTLKAVKGNKGGGSSRDKP